MSKPSPKTIDAPAGVKTVRSRAGLAACDTFAVAEITGPDRTDFLENQLPAHVAAIPPGSGNYTAYLDAKGRITQDLLLLNLDDRYWIVAARDLIASLLEKLDRYHIREKVEFADRSSDLAVLEIHGPAVPPILTRAGASRLVLDPYRHQEFTAEGFPIRFVSHPWTGDVGGHLIVARDDRDRVVEAISAAGSEEGLVPIDEDALEVLRVEGGRPRYGLDVTESTLLLELGREEMVSHDKGCYLGQETVARIHSRGHVNRLFMGLEIEGETVPPPGTALSRGDSAAGETRSAIYSPSLDRVVALAMIRREAAEPGTVLHLHLESGLVAARVRRLPLYHPPGPAEQAENLYREGLARFKADRFEEALDLFERATLMNPHHYAAFESAGVCQERLGRLDDAEETMRSLTEMDPENVMAWTNLSRYAARNGKIEEAEKIKGHVTFLVWKKQAGEKASERAAMEEAAAQRKRLEERIPLFQQVLDLDAEDVVANFGLGKIYLDLERYEEAVPHFERAVAGQKNYSMAYNHLGTCLIRLERLDEARHVLEKGIAAATRKGDLIPKQDMVRKLEGLTG